MCKKGNSFGGSPKNLENLGRAQVTQAKYKSFYGKYSLHKIDELKLHGKCYQQHINIVTWCHCFLSLSVSAT